MVSTARLQNYLRYSARRQYEAVAVPPFTLFFHPTDALPYFNYAIPDLATGGALARLDGLAVGCLRFEAAAGHLHVRRVAVEPSRQGRGVGRALMAWAEAEARRRGLREVTLGVRLALPSNVALYRHLGYRPVSRHAHPGYDRPTWLSMRKRLG